MADIGVSLYNGEDSPLARIDPRTKLLWILWVFAMIVVVLDPLYQSVIIVSIVCAMLAGRLRPSAVISAGRFGLYVGFVSWLLWIFFLPEQGDPLFFVFGRPVTDAGVLTGLSVAIRVIVILFAFVIVAMTTSIRSIITGLYRMRVSTVFAMVIGMILRMIPQLRAEHAVIVEAQRSRGIDFDSGSILTRLRRHMSYAIPLTVRSLKIVNEMGIAMDSRAFDPYAKRTFQPELSFSKTDRWLLVVMALTLVASIALRFAGYAGVPL